MIPKIIHYCWFGRGDKGEETEAYIASWKQAMPDCELIEWNEENFDIGKTIYTKEAYDVKKWAFVADYVRLYALYNFGGLYLDTDYELLRNIDKFMRLKGFIGFESRDSLGTAIIGVEKGNPIIKHLMDDYEKRHFMNSDGSYNTTTNVYQFTNYFEKLGLIKNGQKQKVNDFGVFEQVYFYPNTFSMIFKCKPHKSYGIHHIFASWTKEGGRKRNVAERLKHYAGGGARNILGSERYARIRGIKYR